MANPATSLAGFARLEGHHCGHLVVIGYRRDVRLADPALAGGEFVHPVGEQLPAGVPERPYRAGQAPAVPKVVVHRRMPLLFGAPLGPWLRVRELAALLEFEIPAPQGVPMRVAELPNNIGSVAVVLDVQLNGCLPLLKRVRHHSSKPCSLARIIGTTPLVHIFDSNPIWETMFMKATVTNAFKCASKGGG